jgi:hypothetical protein
MGPLHGSFGVEFNHTPPRSLHTEFKELSQGFQNFLLGNADLLLHFFLDTDCEQGLRTMREGRKYQQHRQTVRIDPAAL